MKWDHITYQGGELRALVAHPEHKAGSKRHDATKYDVTRDRSNLGALWVTNPYKGKVLYVPACNVDIGYAKGLNLAEHRALIQHHRETVGTPADVEKLKAARRDFESMLVALHERRQKASAAVNLARFVDDQRRRLLRSAIVGADGGAEAAQRVDLANGIDLVVGPAPNGRVTPMFDREAARRSLALERDPDAPGARRVDDLWNAPRRELARE